MAASLILFPCRRSRDLLFRRRLPDFHCPVDAGRGDQFAVRAERHARYPIRVPAQGVDRATVPLPDLDRRIRAAPGEAPAVRAEGHTLDPARRVGQVVEELPGLGIPDLDRPIPAARGQELAVGTECHAFGTTGVPEVKILQLTADLQV